MIYLIQNFQEIQNDLCQTVSLGNFFYDTKLKQFFAGHVAYVSPAAPLRIAPCAAHVLMISACMLWVRLCYFYIL